MLLGLGVVGQLSLRGLVLLLLLLLLLFQRVPRFARMAAMTTNQHPPFGPIQADLFTTR